MLQKLNSYHPNIQFTHEVEENNEITFLDVLIKRLENDQLETSVFRKATNTNIYMNWYSHAPKQWKIGTLRSLIKRSVIICSNQKLLEKELNYLRNVFCRINNYPLKLVNDVIKKESEKTNNVNNYENEHIEENKDTIQILLPYAGTQGNNLINRMKKQLKKYLQQNTKVITIYQGTKLSSQFSIKDTGSFEHKNNVVYNGKCPENECKEVN